MRKILIIFLVIFVFGSCSSLMKKQQNYLDAQNAGKFSVDLNSPKFEAGNTEAQFDSPMPFMPLRNVNVTVFYYPVEDAVCLQYRTDSITFNQFWNRTGRQAYVEALEKYNKDFDAQNLRRINSGKTRNQYGKVNGYLYWQVSRVSVQAKGDIEVELGYYFRERAPFFLVMHSNAYYESLVHKEEEKDMYSGERQMYLTRAQAAELASLLDQSYLISTVPDALWQSLIQSGRTNVPFFDYDSY